MLFGDCPKHCRIFRNNIFVLMYIFQKQNKQKRSGGKSSHSNYIEWHSGVFFFPSKCIDSIYLLYAVCMRVLHAWCPLRARRGRWIPWSYRHCKLPSGSSGRAALDISLAPGMQFLNIVMQMHCSHEYIYGYAF